MSSAWENKEPVIRCDRCNKTHIETSIYDASKVHLKYKDLCALCAFSLEDIELVIDEETGFGRLMEKKEIERLVTEF